jgi:tetratricopeptide (TPR) repeat protein
MMLNYANAANASNEVITIDSTEAAREYNEGSTALRAENYTLAESDFRGAISASPKFAEAYCNLGLALMKQGKVDDAITQLTKATELKPGLAVAYLNLGSALQNQGKTAEAVQCFKKFLVLEPNGANSEKARSLMNMLGYDLAGSSNGPFKNGPADYLGEVSRTGVARWPTQDMPIRIYINARPDVPGYRPIFESIIRESFQDWVDASQGKIKIEYVDSADKAHITCTWTEDPNQMISSAEGGHAAVATGSHGILGSQITLLTIMDNHPCTDDQARRVDQHEIGHSFGLVYHSKDPNDAMFGDLRIGDTRTALSERDRNTILALYSLSDEEVAQHLCHAVEIRGDAKSPVVIAAKLNEEARQLIDAHNFTQAIQKLEQASKIDPKNDVFALNLGIAYGNIGLTSMKEGKYTEADQYFCKSFPLLENCSDRHPYTVFMQNYLNLLKYTKRDADAKKVEDKLRQLGQLN